MMHVVCAMEITAPVTAAMRCPIVARYSMPVECVVVTTAHARAVTACQTVVLSLIYVQSAMATDCHALDATASQTAPNMTNVECAAALGSLAQAVTWYRTVARSLTSV